MMRTTEGDREVRCWALKLIFATICLRPRSLPHVYSCIAVYPVCPNVVTSDLSSVSIPICLCCPVCLSRVSELTGAGRGAIDDATLMLLHLSLCSPATSAKMIGSTPRTIRSAEQSARGASTLSGRREVGERERKT